MIKSESVLKIKESARITEVVSQYVTLKKRGTNLIGLCPFHQEKTPSFNVSPTRNIYKCFGCGKSGDPISFLMEHEHFTYPEALKHLADQYQIDVEETESTAAEKEEQSLRESLYIINQFGSDYFSKTLRESDEGRNVGLSYFKERGYLEATVEQFQLGYCPESGRGFHTAAEEAGYKGELMDKLGLTRSKDGRRWDFFRGRVMFPIHNLSGKVVGFGGRTLKKDKKVAKYYNSPESEVYHKSKVLYGIYFAKKQIVQSDNAYMVEGYTDVISLHQAGISNVVASSGTALTPDQVRLLNRYSNNITVLFDGDAAGVKAALRGVEIILEQGMNVRVVALPESEDPDTLVKKLGKDAFTTYLSEHSKDFIRFKTELLLEETRNDPVKKVALIKDIVATIAKVQDPILRSVYLKETASLMDIDEQLLINETAGAVRDYFRKNKKDNAASGSNAGQPATPNLDQTGGVRPTEHHQQVKAGYELDEIQEKDVMRLLFEYEDMTVDEKPALESVIEMTADIAFRNPVFQQIIQIYRDGLNAGKIPETSFFLQHEDAAIRELAISIVHLPWEVSENWQLKHDVHITDKRFIVASDIQKSVALLKLKKLQRMQAMVLGEIKRLELENVDGRHNEEIGLKQQIYVKLQQNVSAFSKLTGSVIIR